MAETRTKQGKGVRKRVEPATSIPGNWQTFLHLDDNKNELFSFLARNVASTDSPKQHPPGRGFVQPDEALKPCTYEEGDTNIILHLEDAVTEGYEKVSIRTVDTNVVLAVFAA